MDIMRILIITTAITLIIAPLLMLYYNMIIEFGFKQVFMYNYILLLTPFQSVKYQYYNKLYWLIPIDFIWTMILSILGSLIMTITCITFYIILPVILFTEWVDVKDRNTFLRRYKAGREFDKSNIT